MVNKSAISKEHGIGTHFVNRSFAEMDSTKQVMCSDKGKGEQHNVRALQKRPKPEGDTSSGKRSVLRASETASPPSGT